PYKSIYPSLPSTPSGCSSRASVTSGASQTVDGAAATCDFTREGCSRTAERVTSWSVKSAPATKIEKPTASKHLSTVFTKCLRFGELQPKCHEHPDPC